MIDHETRVEKGTRIFARSVDSHKGFAIGERITLEPQEVYQCVSTLHGFGSTLVASVEDFARSQGIVFANDKPAPEQKGSGGDADQQLGA